MSRTIFKFFTFVLVVIVLLFWVYYLVFSKKMMFGSRAFPLPEQRELTFSPLVCPKKFMSVLSIDGGGSKGIMPITYLKNLERDRGQKVYQMFDLMGAISTGSIITTALTLPANASKSEPKFNPQDLEQIYFDNVGDFFSNLPRHRILSLNGLTMPVLNSNHKNDFFRKSYEEHSIDDLMSKVIIFVYDVKSQRLRAFCNLESCDKKLNDYYLHSIVSASTNVFVFFPPMHFYDREGDLSYVISDPAVLVNNPSYFTYNEAKSECPDTKHMIFLSLGTGKYPDFTTMDDVLYWGVLDWFAPLLNASFNTNSAIMDHELNKRMIKEAEESNFKELPKTIYIRLNPPIPLELSDPFITSRKGLGELKKIAEVEYRKNKELLNCIIKIKQSDSVDQSCQEEIMAHIKRSKYEEAHRKLPNFLYPN